MLSIQKLPLPFTYWWHKINRATKNFLASTSLGDLEYCQPDDYAIHDKRHVDSTHVILGTPWSSTVSLISSLCLSSKAVSLRFWFVTSHILHIAWLVSRYFSKLFSNCASASVVFCSTSFLYVVLFNYNCSPKSFITAITSPNIKIFSHLKNIDFSGFS